MSLLIHPGDFLDPLPNAHFKTLPIYFYLPASIFSSRRKSKHKVTPLTCSTQLSTLRG